MIRLSGRRGPQLTDHFAQSIKLVLEFLQALDVGAHFPVDVLDAAVEIRDLLGNVLQILDTTRRSNGPWSAGQADRSPWSRNPLSASRSSGTWRSRGTGKSLQPALSLRPTLSLSAALSLQGRSVLRSLCRHGESPFADLRAATLSTTRWAQWRELWDSAVVNSPYHN